MCRYSLVANSCYEDDMLRNRTPRVAILPSTIWTDWFTSDGTSFQYGYKGFTPLSHYPFIILPMFINGNHWIAAIFAYANEATIGNKKVSNPDSPTSLFILDSLNHEHPSLELKLKLLLHNLTKLSGDDGDTIPGKNLRFSPVYYPKVRV